MDKLTLQQKIRFGQIVFALGVAVFEQHRKAKNLTTEATLEQADALLETAEDENELLKHLGHES